MQQGTIDQSQGQYLMTQLARKYNEINMCKNSFPSVNQPQPPVALNPMDLFNQL